MIQFFIFCGKIRFEIVERIDFLRMIVSQFQGAIVQRALNVAEDIVDRINEFAAIYTA